MKPGFANLQGYLAVLLWSFAALYISWTPQIPPFLLAALTSAIGFSFFAFGWLRKPAQFNLAIRQKWQIWVLFFFAVVVYRGFYLSGLKLAPIVEANLLNYLWPLLIVLLPSLWGSEKLSKRVFLGALCCFAGVICIGISKKGFGFSFAIGHLLSIAAAFTWAIYSITTRRFVSAPTDMIGLMHVVAVGVFLSLHHFFEPAVNLSLLPTLCWAGIIGLGVAISLGYSLWDSAMTHGHRETVAMAAYYIPLLSTLWLFLFKGQQITLWVGAAAILIIGGSLFARLSANKPKKA